MKCDFVCFICNKEQEESPFAIRDQNWHLNENLGFVGNAGSPQNQGEDSKQDDERQNEPYDVKPQRNPIVSAVVIVVLLLL